MGAEDYDPIKVRQEFEKIVSDTRGISYLERIVGIVYDFTLDEDCAAAGLIYMNERSSAQDLFLPNVFDALESMDNFHVFLANFLERNPDTRVFIGLDDDRYPQARYAFDLFVVGKTRLCSNINLPSVDASICSPIFDEGGEYEMVTDSATVWENHGDSIKEHLILEGTDVDTAVLTRMVLDGTDRLLRILIATHPAVTKPLLLALLQQADPTEYHLFSVILNHRLMDDEVAAALEEIGG